MEHISSPNHVPELQIVPTEPEKQPGNMPPPPEVIDGIIEHIKDEEQEEKDRVKKIEDIKKKPTVH